MVRLNGVTGNSIPQALKELESYSTDERTTIYKLDVADGEGPPPRVYFVTQISPEYLLKCNQREDLRRGRHLISSVRSLADVRDYWSDMIATASFWGLRSLGFKDGGGDAKGKVCLTVDPAAKVAVVGYLGASAAAPPEDLIPGRRLQLAFHAMPRSGWRAEVSLAGDDTQAVETVLYLISIFGISVNF